MVTTILDSEFKRLTFYKINGKLNILRLFAVLNRKVLSRYGGVKTASLIGEMSVALVYRNCVLLHNLVDFQSKTVGESSKMTDSLSQSDFD